MNAPVESILALARSDLTTAFLLLDQRPGAGVAEARTLLATHLAMHVRLADAVIGAWLSTRDDTPAADRAADAIEAAEAGVL